ncbi:hypothetical protein HMPREF0973_00379 [Prevotella veroralis F0319]|uniref:Uncharacterized protein n=1 Tax=Prevotella veroralis F0319 TaxID=649761 RepID=C9MLA5_9BACT|nr:hypothetical protein HMPREF0973_00379 [Prevotella veroralis F0319]
MEGLFAIVCYCYSSKYKKGVKSVKRDREVKETILSVIEERTI